MADAFFYLLAAAMRFRLESRAHPHRLRRQYKSSTSACEERQLSSVKAMCESDSERIETIRRWHIDQAVGSNVTVALLNIAINMDGEISTKGLCIEPEHAPAMLAELQQLIRLFEDKAHALVAPVAGPCANGSAFAVR